MSRKGSRVLMISLIGLLAGTGTARALRYQDVKLVKRFAVELRRNARVLLVHARNRLESPGRVEPELVGLIRTFHEASLEFQVLVESDAFQDPGYRNRLRTLNATAARIAPRLKDGALEPVRLEWDRAMAFLDSVNGLIDREPPPLLPDAYGRKQERLLDTARRGTGINDLEPDEDRFRVDEDGDIEDYDLDEPVEPVRPDPDQSDEARLRDLDFGNEPNDDRFRVGEDGYLEDYDLDG